MKTKQVFWDFPLTESITSVNSEPVSARSMEEFLSIYTDFSIVEDDTDVPVLMVETEENSVTITYGSLNTTSISVTCDFWGTRPVRPT